MRESLRLKSERDGQKKCESYLRIEVYMRVLSNKL